MMNGTKKLLITDISRIDYPEPRDRQEANPLGLIIYFADTPSILRMNIGNTGQNVEHAFQSQGELSFFLSEYYGVLVTDSKPTSQLSHLQGQSVIRMELGYYSEIGTKMQGTNFELLSGEIVAVRLFLSNTNIFTFYNEGDEGDYSFSVFCKISEFAFSSVSWREIQYHLVI
jgi:hypothetical protein